jgi:hypothetical protein
MKILSVLLTVALFATANTLAAHLKHAKALPVHPTPAPSDFLNPHHNQ